MTAPPPTTTDTAQPAASSDTLPLLLLVVAVFFLFGGITNVCYAIIARFGLFAEAGRMAQAETTH